ncbi:MAG: hypothetical protein Q9217_002422 [Psora testacea]
MGSTIDLYTPLLSSTNTPSLTPASSFESDWESDARPRPITLSIAMAQEPIDPEDNGKQKEYTFAKLLKLIQKHNMYLPHPDDEAEEIGETSVPGYLLRKDHREMTEEEMLDELAQYEQDRNEGRLAQENSFLSEPAGKLDPWSVNHRRERLGHDPAVTINHLAGSGEIVYHYPNPVFNLLALETDLRAYLMSWLMAGVCGGKEVVPYGYWKDKCSRGKRKPLVEVMVALCTSRNRKAIETLEMARCALYTQNRFTFSHPKQLLRFLGSIGRKNIRRLSFEGNIKVARSFFTVRKTYDLEMLWLQRWTNELRKCMKATGKPSADTGQCLQGNLSRNDEANPREEGEDLWRAIMAINEVLNDAEKMDEMLNPASGIDQGTGGRTSAEARMRIQTLDLGGKFADVAEQLKRMDLGLHNNEHEIGLPHPHNDVDFKLYAQNRRKWCDRWLENKRAIESNFDNPDILRCTTITDTSGLSISREGLGRTWYLDSASAAENLGTPLRRSSREAVNEPADDVKDDDTGVKKDDINQESFEEQSKGRGALQKLERTSRSVSSTTQRGSAKGSGEISTSKSLKKKKKAGKDIDSVAALKNLGIL